MPFSPALSASRASAAISPASWGSLRSWFHWVRSRSGNLSGDAREKSVGDVARALLSLLAIEGLDEVPCLLLPTGGEHRHLLGHEYFRLSGRGLQRVVLDPQIAGPHPSLDHRRQVLEREVSAERALEVPEVHGG